MKVLEYTIAWIVLSVGTSAGLYLTLAFLYGRFQMDHVGWISWRVTTVAGTVFWLFWTLVALGKK